MARERDLKVYELSKYRVKELKYFCLQYGEKRKRLNRLSLNDRTGNERDSLIKDISIIEWCASQAGDGIYDDAILKNVTQGIKYEYLGIVPTGRRQFYEARRKFFYLLHTKKG